MLGIGLSDYIPIAIYVLGGVFFLISVFWKTEYCLLFLCPLLPLQVVVDKVHELPYGKDFVDILMGGMLLGMIIRSGREGSTVFKKTEFTIPIMGLIVVSFAGLLQGMGTLGEESGGTLLRDWKNFVLMLLLYTVTADSAKDTRLIKILCWVMLLTMIPMDWYFFKTFRWVKKWHYQDSVRTAGTFTFLGPNELAAFYAQYTFVAIGLLVFEKLWSRRAVLVGIIGGNVYCILYTYSRAAYLSFVVAAVLLLLFVKRKLLVVLIALGALGYTMIPVSVIERVQMTEDEEGELDGSSEGRLELWEFGLKLWQESPIWGTGAGVYNVKAREMDRRERTRDPHNMYIKVLVQWGLVGLFFFLWIYLRGLRLSWRLYRRSGDEWMKGLGLGFLLCIVANMVMNFFHDAYSYVNVMGFYWVWLGLIVSALRIQQEEAAKSEEEVAVRLFFEGVGNGRKLS